MKRSLLALTLLATAPLAAQADELSYSYIEGGYQRVEADGGFDADGWQLGGSAALGDNFHLFGSYGAGEIDDVDFDIDAWRVGLGYNRSLSPAHDLVARLAYESAEVETPIGDIDGDGWSTEFGVRSAWAPKFQSYLALGYADGDEADGEFYGHLEGEFKFNRSWGLVASARVGEDATQYFIGPRISF